MTVRDRFNAVFNFEKPEGGIPNIEWAAFWDLTVKNWQQQGLALNDTTQILKSLGLDELYLINAPTQIGLPAPAYHGGPLMENEEDYKRIRGNLLTDQGIEILLNTARHYKEGHDKGEFAVRLWLDGFFWYPRTLFGIEGHMFAFYDYPELMHEMNRELMEYHIRCIDALFDVMIPDMVGIAEDMSYNNGPMLSKDCFDEFLAPYYKTLVDHIKTKRKNKLPKILVDTDGLLHDLIPWLTGVGIEGIYPLERQSKVDVNYIRRTYPEFLMLGGFDKTVMHQGEEAMRWEFERLKPVIESGGYIPSVDHQTPPDCSFENFQIYVKLLKEYCAIYQKQL